MLCRLEIWVCSLKDQTFSLFKDATYICRFPSTGYGSTLDRILEDISSDRSNLGCIFF